MGISLWQLGVVLVIVLLLFGTKKLRNLGGDLGGAIKGFKKAMNTDENAERLDEDGSQSDDQVEQVDSGVVSENKATEKQEAGNKQS